MRSIDARNDFVTNSTTSNLFHHNNGSEWNQTLMDDGSTYPPCSTSSSDLSAFFILPCLGLFTLIMGSIYLRQRRIQQSRRSTEIYNERVRAHLECLRVKKMLRLEMIESALVTTKVIMDKQDLPQRRSSFALTERSDASSFDDSNSSANSAIESSCDDLEAQTQNEQLDTSTSCPSESSLTLEHPLEVEGWKLETCAICLEPYKENDSVSYSKHKNCSHAFHTDCILNWFLDEYRNDCPYCRGQYVHVCIVESDDDLFAEASAAGGNNFDTADPTTEEGNNFDALNSTTEQNNFDTVSTAAEQNNFDSGTVRHDFDTMNQTTEPHIVVTNEEQSDTSIGPDMNQHTSSLDRSQEDS